MKKFGRSISPLMFIRFKVVICCNTSCCGIFLFIGATCSHINVKSFLYLYVFCEILFCFLFLHFFFKTKQKRANL